MYTKKTYGLRNFGCIPIRLPELTGLLNDYSSPNDKVSNMVKQGDLIRLKRGLYCVSPHITEQRLSNELIANHLYGPSYVSLETALAFYKLIPERMASTQSVITKRAKVFETALGRFTYTTVPEDYYALGIRQEQVDNRYVFLIATPEKALCDTILLRSNLRITSEKAMHAFLEEYMRVDLQEIIHPDLNIIDACITTNHKATELGWLRKVIEHECI